MSKLNPAAGSRLSAETVHASTVTNEGRAVLITGPSGSGKSDLALRLLDRGFKLVSDDRTLVKKDGERLIASAPPAIAGKLEVRGIGIVDVPLICAQELDIVGAMPLVVRILAHVETYLAKSEIQHVYLGATAALRKDIAQ